MISYLASHSTLILIIAIVLIAAGLTGIVISFSIVASPSYDVSSVSGPKPEYPLIMGMAFIAVGLALLILLGKKQDDAAYSRYVRATAPDSGYSVYYEGQAVSGGALGVDKNNFYNFDITYDEQNKIIKIMQKR